MSNIILIVIVNYHPFINKSSLIIHLIVLRHLLLLLSDKYHLQIINAVAPPAGGRKAVLTRSACMAARVLAPVAFQFIS